MIFGVDEAGRGPLAGPVVAAAVLLCKPRPSGLDDSKKLSAARRAELEETIKRRCQWAVGIVDVDDIDRLNIFGATMLAMTRAVDALGEAPAHVLVDGNRLPKWRWPATAIIGGDGCEPAISAASIIAKVTRDRIMAELDAAHPGYGWATNQGYGVAAHADVLNRLGATPHHRASFAPVRAVLQRLREEISG